MATIDENGISIDSYETAYTDLSTAYKEIYGQDINIDQDTTDGQFLALIAKLKRDFEENLVSVYNAFDPDTAEGVQIERLLKFCGIVRASATKSTVDVDITTDRTLSLPSDYTLTDELNQNWIISSSQILASGTTSVSFEAEDFGSISANANTITSQNTIVLGVVSVTNPLAATEGEDETTDTQLKIERAKSVSLPSENTVEGLQAKLLTVENVIDAVVLENKTLVYDATLDLNAKTIWAIVEGGAIEDIGTVLSIDRGAGVDMKGNISYTYTKQQPRNDGTFRQYDDLVKFDRPTEIPIYIKLDIALKAGSTSYDIDTIKAAIAEKTFNIGENATVTELYSYVYNGGNTFIATNLQISDDNITYVSDKLVANADARFTIDVANITITEV